MKDVIDTNDTHKVVAYLNHLLAHAQKPWEINGLATRYVSESQIEVLDLGVQPTSEEVEKHISLVGVDVL